MTTASYTSHSPHLSDDYTPLEDLVLKALRHYGEMEVGTMSEDALLLFIDFANEVIDEVNRHPYRTDLDPISYYTAFSDTRPVPDQIMSMGLAYQYSMQQGSAKTEFYRGKFFNTMHKHLYYQRWGNARIEMQTMDRRKTFAYPSRPQNIEEETSS